MKPEWWGSPLVQEKYREEKACDKRHPHNNYNNTNNNNNNDNNNKELVIDSVVLEQAHKDNRNLYTAYIDYRKAFDSVPHSWPIHVLQIYKIDPQIINSLQQSMKKWTTTLQVKAENHWIMSDLIHTQRGIYQRDSLRPLWFCLALNPLSYLLNRTYYGFDIHSGNQEMQHLNHLL